MAAALGAFMQPEVGGTWATLRFQCKPDPENATAGAAAAVSFRGRVGSVESQTERGPSPSTWWNETHPNVASDWTGCSDS